MHYTKPMIELVYEIRRLVPSELKPGVKLANPDLFAELADYFHQNPSTIVKALIKELFRLSEDEDLLALIFPPAEPQTEEPEAKGAKLFKSYRGILSLEKKVAGEALDGEGGSDEGETPAKKKRMYRGQVVA